MNIRDFQCRVCGQPWSEESTARGAKPQTCPTCDPRAARHRAIREQTRKRLLEVKSDSVLLDAAHVTGPGKPRIAEALRSLARARGRAATSAAARELAVQSLAWSLALSVGADGVSDNQPV